MPKMPPGASIMEQFKILAGAIMSYPKPTGTVTMFRPDGTSPAPGGYTAGGTIFEPWGLNIDGNGDVWVANTNGKSVVYMAGDDTKGHPAGVKTGDAIHVFSSGSTQQVLTDPS